MTPRTVAIDARLAWGQATGDSTYWSGLILGLSEVQPDLIFLLYSDQPKPRHLPDIPNLRWRQITARSSRWWSLVAFPLAARKAGARVVHTQYNLSPLVRQGGITTIHDVSFFIGPEWFLPRDRFFLQKMVPRSVQRAAKVLTVSETSKREIEQFIPAAKGKTEVTYNALNPFLPPLPRDQGTELRAKLGIGDQPYVLTVGTRWPRKNTSLAIEAVRLLPSDLPHRLILTGKAGWGGEELHDRVITPGYVREDELVALYQGASLTLVPSHHEGFGLIPLEAWMSGCPVLSSMGGALPEIVQNPEALLASWNPQDWANRMAELLRDSSTLARMVQAGKQRLTDFSWSETARKTVAVYEEVIG